MNLTQEEKKHLIIVLAKEMQQNTLDNDMLSLQTNKKIVEKIKNSYLRQKMNKKDTS